MLAGALAGIAVNVPVAHPTSSACRGAAPREAIAAVTTSIIR
jgi:hypothetical protein